MTVLVRDVLFDVSVLLGDANPQFERYAVNELVSWANDGQRALATYMPTCGSRVDVIKLKPGARQHIAHIAQADVIPGDGSAASDVTGIGLNDVVRNMGADGLSPGRAITIASRDFIERFNRSWSKPIVGRKEAEHFMFDPRTPRFFWVYPAVPSDQTWWAEVSFNAEPRRIPLPVSDADYAKDGSSAETIGVGDLWKSDLVNYVAARALMKDAESSSNVAKVNLYAQTFINSLNAQVAALTGNNPNLKHLPLSPAIPAAAS